MENSITISGLPDGVVDELKRRADNEGLSFEEYMHLEIEGILFRNPRPDWAARGQEPRRAWDPRTMSEIIVEDIRQHRGW